MSNSQNYLDFLETRIYMHDFSCDRINNRLNLFDKKPKDLYPEEKRKKFNNFMTQKNETITDSLLEYYVEGKEYNLSKSLGFTDHMETVFGISNKSFDNICKYHDELSNLKDKKQNFETFISETKGIDSSVYNATIDYVNKLSFFIFSNIIKDLCNYKYSINAYHEIPSKTVFNDTEKEKVFKIACDSILNHLNITHYTLNSTFFFNLYNENEDLSNVAIKECKLISKSDIAPKVIKNYFIQASTLYFFSSKDFQFEFSKIFFKKFENPSSLFNDFNYKLTQFIQNDLLFLMNKFPFHYENPNESEPSSTGNYLYRTFFTNNEINNEKNVLEHIKKLLINYSILKKSNSNSEKLNKCNNEINFYKNTLTTYSKLSDNTLKITYLDIANCSNDLGCKYDLSQY